jgi:hypothetical protein
MKYLFLILIATIVATVASQDKPPVDSTGGELSNSQKAELVRKYMER